MLRGVSWRSSQLGVGVFRIGGCLEISKKKKKKKLRNWAAQAAHELKRSEKLINFRGQPNHGGTGDADETVERWRRSDVREYEFPDGEIFQGLGVHVNPIAMRASHLALNMGVPSPLGNHPQVVESSQLSYPPGSWVLNMTLTSATPSAKSMTSRASLPAPPP